MKAILALGPAVAPLAPAVYANGGAPHVSESPMFEVPGNVGNMPGPGDAFWPPAKNPTGPARCSYVPRLLRHATVQPGARCLPFARHGGTRQ